jgi:hypothetical protein
VGGTVIRFKNKSISTLKRKKNPHNKGFDPDTSFFQGNMKYQPWSCRKCGSPMEPWYEDEFGDLVVSCTNPNCICSKDFGGSINVELSKLVKKLNNNSNLYYRGYDGRWK